MSSSHSDIEKVVSAIIEKVKPRREDYERLRQIYDTVSQLLTECLSPLNREFVISLQGSVAKDTFIRGEVDIDVFVLFNPQQVDETWFGSEFVNIVTECFKRRNYEVRLEYATHPYVTAVVDGVEVNVVPAFRVENPKKIISAVDRTPFHTEYVVKKLSPEQRDHVRVLKLFLKAWNIYGAEVAVQGFSGYVTELLVIAYGSFDRVLKAATKWRPYRTCIDIEGHYPDERRCIERFRDSVLVVVDPIDPDRNAAAAVSIKSFALFKLLSYLFTIKPSLEFFDKPRTIVPSTWSRDIHDRLRAIGSCLIHLVFKVRKPIPDAVWGQLRRVERVLLNELKSLRLSVLAIDSWVDKSLSRAVVAIEIADCDKEFEVHKGPIALDLDNALRFLIKNANALAGPWLGYDGRLYCIRKRKYSAYEAVERIAKKLASLSVLELERVESDIPTIANHDFVEWLYGFVFRKQFERIARIMEST